MVIKKNGFWAKSKDQELACEGLSVSFLVSVEDVTAKVLKGITSTSTEAKKDSIIKANIKVLEKEAVAGTHYESFIKRGLCDAKRWGQTGSEPCGD